MPPALLELFDKIGGPRRALILAVGFSAALGVFGLARWLNAPSWVSALADVPISDVGAITDRLSQEGIEFRLGASGNSIQVKSTELARARVALARAGILPSTDRPGWELFNSAPFGQTDLMQRVNLQRAIEGELEKTIGGMRGIRAAKVHIVLPEQETYGAPAIPAEASVVLIADGGEPIQPDVVKGIARTVASSVGGLTTDHVNIVDDAGRTLSDADEPLSGAAVSNRQMEMQREMENALKAKTEKFLEPVVGRGRAKVEVSALLNFDRVERTSQTVNPDKQAVVEERKSEIIPGAEGGAASSQTGASYQNSVATESISSAVGSLKRLTVAVVLDGGPAPGVGNGGGNGADSAAAPATPMDSAALRAQVETLVKSAVGFDESRGDVVTVSMLPFAAAPVRAAIAPPTTLETLQTVQRPALTALGIVFAFIIALMTLRAAGKSSETVTALATAGAPAGYMPDASQAGAYQGAFQGAAAQAGLPTAASAGSLPQAPRQTQTPLIVVPNNPVREQVLASVSQQPEVAAKLMRAWLRDA